MSTGRHAEASFETVIARERASFPETVLAVMRETQPNPAAVTGQIDVGASA